MILSLTILTKKIEKANVELANAPEETQEEIKNRISNLETEQARAKEKIEELNGLHSRV